MLNEIYSKVVSANTYLKFESFKYNKCNLRDRACLKKKTYKRFIFYVFKLSLNGLTLWCTDQSTRVSRYIFIHIKNTTELLLNKIEI